MKLVKVLPLLILVSGGVVAVTQGPKMASKIVTKVKILVTEMELARIADEIRFEFLSVGRVPGERNPDEFANFLRKNFQPYWGTRDTAYDLWGALFWLDPRTDRETTIRVVSSGPNMALDCCEVVNGRRVSPPACGDDICAIVDLPVR